MWYILDKGDDCNQMAETEAQRRAHQKYRSKQKQVAIAFKQDELYLFEFLEKQGNKTEYIKNLIKKSYESML